MTKIITRFAPSPTGKLHIGGARTALFNWLFAKHHQGAFYLRIEDTDTTRSTQAACDQIIAGLDWLGLDWEGDMIRQSTRIQRHQEVARQLLAQGQAYYCYTSKEELEEMREQARAEGKPARYNGYWRDRDPKEAPLGIAPVIRLKAPQTGNITLTDAVQGAVTVSCDQMDDMVLLRQDGSPTYMLSVVVDDIDMEITHIIRGDDHLTNAFRQSLIYQALGKTVPVFAHIPLIHNNAGKKLSKRDDADDILAYRKAGFLPEALCNYLLRLGWSHGDEEIITREQAMNWFDLKQIGKSPARLDPAKMDFINQHYLRQKSPAELYALLEPFWPEVLPQRKTHQFTPTERNRLLCALPVLLPRAKNLLELAEATKFCLLPRPIPLEQEAQDILGETKDAFLQHLRQKLANLENWDKLSLDTALKGFAARQQVKFSGIGLPLRAAWCGSKNAPGIYDIANILGQDECIGRLDDVLP